MLLFSHVRNGTSNVRIVNSNSSGRGGSYEILEKSELGFVFGAHRTQFSQLFATSPNFATLLARKASWSGQFPTYRQRHSTS